MINIFKAYYRFPYRSTSIDCYWLLSNNFSIYLKKILQCIIFFLTFTQSSHKNTFNRLITVTFKIFSTPIILVYPIELHYRRQKKNDITTKKIYCIQLKQRFSFCPILQHTLSSRRINYNSRCHIIILYVLLSSQRIRERSGLGYAPLNIK